MYSIKKGAKMMSLLVFLLWKIVKSQTICLSGANNINGWINGEYTFIGLYNSYPAYFQDLNHPENDGCGYSGVYIHSMLVYLFIEYSISLCIITGTGLFQPRYVIRSALGSGDVFAQCDLSKSNPLNCNGNWVVSSTVITSIEINSGSCPWADCGSIKTSNSLNSVTCSPNSGYTLDWEGKNSYRNQYSSYYLIWNKILQQWICKLGNDIGCSNLLINGYQTNPGWPTGLNTGKSVVIDWNIDATTISQMSMQCIGMYSIK